MNREIKFRAWDKSEKKFRYPKLWDNTMPSNWDKHYDLQQYTGLKDKNGVEIYEGDLFTSTFTKERVFRVFYGEFKSANDSKLSSSIGFYSVEDRDKISFGKSVNGNMNHLEVIGNIYENPELIK